MATLHKSISATALPWLLNWESIGQETPLVVVIATDYISKKGGNPQYYGFSGVIRLMGQWLGLCQMWVAKLDNLQIIVVFYSAIQVHWRLVSRLQIKCVKQQKLGGLKTAGRYILLNERVMSGLCSFVESSCGKNASKTSHYNHHLHQVADTNILTTTIAEDF